MDLFHQGEDLSGLNYQQLKERAEKCKLCQLHATRKKVVFGNGPVPCDLMLIGEGPGEQEDLTGLPFVGKAGQLLTKILESAEIKRETDIYITNIVKCRPPENRTPQIEEAQACLPYLETQIKTISPKIIILAGSPAVKTILRLNDPISSIRGKWFSLPGTSIQVFPIYHPSYLLRNQSKSPGSPKWQTWQDMQELKNAVSFLKKVKELEK